MKTPELHYLVIQFLIINVIIQLAYTIRIPIFWLVDLYLLSLGCDETTSLTSLSWCNSRGVSQHSTVITPWLRLTHSLTTSVCSIFNLNNENVKALLARELSGFTCTRLLTMNSKYSYWSFSFIVSEPRAGKWSWIPIIHLLSALTFKYTIRECCITILYYAIENIVCNTINATMGRLVYYRWVCNGLLVFWLAVARFKSLTISVHDMLINWWPSSHLMSLIFPVCCWFSTLLQEVFLRVLRFFLLLKNQHFQIPIPSGMHGHFWNSSCELLGVLWVNNLHLHYIFTFTFFPW